MTTLLLGVLVAAGCSEWPRYGHLDDSDADPIPAGTDPASQFELTWTNASEATDNDVSTEIAPEALQRGVGVVYAGQLDGTGWYDGATAAPITDVDCPGAEGDRSPMPLGDYVGDVDFYRVTVTEPGQLCARATVDPPTFGWDLVVFPVDACGVPDEPIARGEGPIGVDLGGAADGWGLVVDDAPTELAILIAGYYPNDAEAVLTYQLGLSLVRPTPTADGTGELCPRLPSETAAEE